MKARTRSAISASAWVMRCAWRTYSTQWVYRTLYPELRIGQVTQQRPVPGAVAAADAAAFPPSP